VIDKIVTMINYVKANKINGKQAKQIFPIICSQNKAVDDIINELGMKQITDKDALREILKRLIEQNQETVKQYNTRPERVEKFLIGALMKETKGQANPQVVKTTLDELLVSYK
jgi:aspartyl-tRNA(Asn)/glutamyl-tRNA(Gln) amidotransferase subunit B